MYACKYGKPTRAGPFGRGKAKPDEDATRHRLYKLLLEKVPDQGDLMGSRNVPAETDGMDSGMRRGPLSRSVSESGGEGGVGGGALASTAPAGLSATPGSLVDGQGGAPGAASTQPLPGQTPAGRRDPIDLEAHAVAERKEREREKQAFVDKVCTRQTRSEVVDWVGKIYTIMAKKDAEERALEAKSRRRFQKGGAASDSGISGTTMTGGGGSGHNTALAAAGHKLASGYRAPSLISAESMVVHHGQGGGNLSVPERLRSYLRGDYPELKEHVSNYVQKKSTEVEKKIDDDMADSFLKVTTKREVFSGKDNFLRWQNTRRASIQRVLDAELPKWIWEAIQNWDHSKIQETRAAEVNETDLIFDYLTKRAAHIDHARLATEIPIFKPLKASYSLPSMWRDKYS